MEKQNCGVILTGGAGGSAMMAIWVSCFRASGREDFDQMRLASMSVIRLARLARLTCIHSIEDLAIP